MTYLERKAERQKRIQEQTSFLLREQREAHAAHLKSKRKPMVRPPKDDRDPNKMRVMFWLNEA